MVKQANVMVKQANVSLNSSLERVTTLDDN
jgi:hypothetical protein